MGDPVLEQQPSKDSLGEKILNGAHRFYDGAVEFAFGKQVYIPFTERKMSRLELWAGLPIVVGLLVGQLAEVGLGVSTGLAAFRQDNLDTAIAVGLIASAAGAGMGVSASLGIEVMSDLKKLSSRVATGFHKYGDKVMGRAAPPTAKQ